MTEFVETRPWLSLPAGILAAVAVLWFRPLVPAAAPMLAITLFCIVLWIATPVPPAYTGLVCLGLVGVTFSPELAFVGFRSSALWLVVFGLLLGEATRTSGLTLAGSRWLLARAWPGRIDGGSLPADRAYRRLLAVLSVAGVALALLIPSALVRVLTIAPIVGELGESFESDRARAGIFLGPLLVTFFAAPGIFTAGLPNIILVGIAESLGVHDITWSAWTARMFPVMGIGRAVVVTAVVYALYRPASDTAIAIPATSARGSPAARRMFGFLLVGVVFWMTDSLHGIHPVFGALLVVLLALLPGYGVVSLDELADVDFSIVFFLGAVFAIGQGLTKTGFSEAAASGLLGFVPAGASLPVVLLFVFGISLALMFLMEGLAVASVLTPVIVSYARDVGLPIGPVLMTESIALSTPFFPYQSAVLVAILGEGDVEAGELVRTVFWASVLTIFVLLPLQIGIFAWLY